MIKGARRVKDLIRNKAEGDSSRSQALLRHYAMERFLERLANSPYRDNFVLKGGMLMSSLVGVDQRSTMDIDATVKGLTLDMGNALKVVEEIAVVELDDGDLLHDLEGVAHIERQSLDGRVDVHRAALVHAHERGHQHAALEHEVVPVWGVREPLQEPLHSVVAQERLGPAAVPFGLVADQVLHPARALYHRSTSIACCTCLSTPISLA